MREILSEITKWREQDIGIAIATNVRMRGSGLRPLGAKMAISEDGDFSGSVSGGCIEGAVVEAALDVLKTGVPKLLYFGVSDDAKPWDIGLTCGTSLEVLVEPLGSADWKAVYPRLLDQLQANQPCALITDLSEQNLGRKMLVTTDGVQAGAIGGAAESTKLVKLAQEHTRANKQAVKTVSGTDIFIDVLPPPARLVVIGAVHVAIPLVEMAKVMGFRTIVIDPRSAFAQPERFPQADAIIKKWPQEALPELKLDQGTYVAALSHDDKLDNPALAIALQSDTRYVGVIGARTNIPKRKNNLREMGVSEEHLSRLHAPIGLPIKALLPEEIAISILAEMIAEKYGAGHEFYPFKG